MPALPSRVLTQRLTDSSIPRQLAPQSGLRPPWMLSNYCENSWEVTDIGAKPNKVIRFDVRLPNGKRLTDYEHLAESIKRIVFGVRVGPLMEVESGSVQASLASNLITLTRWMITNRIERFNDLTSVDVREYAQLAVGGTHLIVNSEGVLTQYLEQICTAAAFRDDDTTAVRHAKALTVFPYYSSGYGGRQKVLNRQQVLIDAGLEGIGSNGKHSVLTSILDDVAAFGGFYQDRRTKDRLRSEPSIDELDAAIVTTEHLRRLLMPFDYLYRHRRYLDDAIHRDLFPLSSPSAEARKLGKTIGRTNSVPVKQAATLIERSIRWILDYAPALLELKDYSDSLFDSSDVTASEQFNRELAQRSWPFDHQDSPFPIVPGLRQSTSEGSAEETVQALTLRHGMTLPVALTFLQTACAIVIGAFSARRAAEIVGLKAGCIERDAIGNPWMRVFIHKTTQDDSIIPVPEVVASAVSVLEEISARARAKSRTPYLFQVSFYISGTETFRGISENGFPIFILGAHLRKFGYFLDVPTLSDGTRWTFRPHQLRRFFAILYIWIYELGDWGALSYHLRHFNPEMTRRYVSDDELGHIISIADREHTAQILANAAIGKTHISGLRGERLVEAAKRMYAQMNQRIQVVPERKFVQRILRFVERTGTTLHALPWGYCAISRSSNMDTCSCSTNQGAPQFGEATVSTCKDCNFGLRTDAFLPYLNSSLQFHHNIAHSEGTPVIFRKASETLMRELGEYVTSLNPNRVSAEVAS